MRSRTERLLGKHFGPAGMPSGHQRVNLTTSFLIVADRRYSPARHTTEIEPGGNEWQIRFREWPHRSSACRHSWRLRRRRHIARRRRGSGQYRLSESRCSHVQSRGRVESGHGREPDASASHHPPECFSAVNRRLREWFRLNKFT